MKLLSRLLSCALLAAASSEQLKNVLFIAVDDLRPELNHLGHQYMHTPNIDKLASEGMSFQRAYVQYSYCGPSRNSFMTGRRPDATKAWSFMNHFRQVGPNWTTMPQYFKEKGYYTVGTGKLFHPGLPPSFDAQYSWEEFTFSSGCKGTTNGFPVLQPNVTNVKCPAATTYCPGTGPSGGPTPPDWCAVNTTELEHPLEDTVSVESAKDYLRKAKDSGKNFFVAVGLHKPHLPWVYPLEFNNTYPDVSGIHLPAHPNVPEGMPLCAWHEGHFNNTWLHDTSEYLTKTYRRAYYSAVSFTDYNIGEVLREVDRLELTNTTLVVVMGDHGWQLGEMNLWKKMTNFELGVRVPLIVRAPWLPKSVNKKTTAFAEAVDLYQTMVDLSGLPPSTENLQGDSLGPIIRDGIVSGTGIKNYTFSQFAKNFTYSDELHKQEAWNECGSCTHHDIDLMGFSVRSDNWRYTEWVVWNKSSLLPIWDQIHAKELYNHTSDFAASMDFSTPTVNLVNESTLQKVVSDLSVVLKGHFVSDQTMGN
eukprot:TRINITY_DN2266_c1_g1_i1.p1 TRINITY_DN2266_c1_g1~~TRINITY_DN2266_c1_g1_i1.p1  ORF type:complete len:532 (+),score=87.49 TRINITY_DN2266_c1_g1_i1:48-1643(+)